MAGDWDAAALTRIGDVIRTESPTNDGRSFPIYAATWRGWFDGTKLAAVPPWSELALHTLDDLEKDEEVPAHCDGRRVDRARLLRLSETVARNGTDETRVELLFTTLLWGSGTSNGRGPRYAAAALSDARLTDVLAKTAGLVASGHLAEAHSRFRVNRIGPAFFTKWFWAVGLAGSRSPHPLILDSVVAGTLAALSDTPWPLYGRAAAGRYVEYVERVDRWSGTLGVDAETVEYMLFRRPAGLLP